MIRASVRARGRGIALSGLHGEQQRVGATIAGASDARCFLKALAPLVAIDWDLFLLNDVGVSTLLDAGRGQGIRGGVVVDPCAALLTGSSSSDSIQPETDDRDD